MKVAFYKATRPGLQGIFNRLVRWWTNGPYSHCELVLEEDNGRGALCASSSFLDGGVRLKRIRLDAEHWDVVELDSRWSAKEALEWFEQHEGLRYDVFGLVAFVWRRGHGARGKWYCSEAVAAALGIPDPWRYDPNGLSAVLAAMR